jgi:hypothetical protein
MRNLQLLAVQLVESLRLLQAGSPERFRLALILLDNAAELQLRWAALDELRRDEDYERMRVLLTQDLERQPEAELPETLRDIVARKPLPENLGHKLQHYFEEKVRYLSVEKNRVAAPIAEALRFLHDYRSRAKHAGVLEDSLLRILGFLLLEVNCVLLESLAPSVTSWASDEGYSFLDTEFGVNFQTRHRHLKVAATLRKRFDLEATEVATVLTAELTDRLSTISGYLDFLVTAVARARDHEAALVEAQYHVYRASNPGSPIPRQDFRPKYDLKTITRIVRRVSGISSSRTAVDAFRRFAHIVCVFRPKATTDSSLKATTDSDGMRPPIPT